MSKKCLVTQDLISAVDWCNKAPNSPIKDQPDPLLTWKRKAFEDLSNKLNRVYGDMPVAAQRGINFENKLYECAREQRYVGSDTFINLIKRIENHHFQYKIKQDLKVVDYDCFLYGKMDAYVKGDMIDIKTTAKFDKSKYTGSWQHVLYCYCQQETNFTYIVAEWDEYPKIKEVHIVEIKDLNLDMLRLQVKEKILKTFKALEDMELWDIYREKYCLY